MSQTADPEVVAPAVGAIVPHPPTFRVSELPDDVFPSLITVFCDGCGDEESEDVLVRESDESHTRFGYLRAHLRRRGWQCNVQGDLCPDCLSQPPGPAANLSPAMKRAHTYASIFINAGEKWRNHVPVDATLGRDDDLYLQGVHMERGKSGGGWRLTENDESWIIRAKASD